MSPAFVAVTVHVPAAVALSVKLGAVPLIEQLVVSGAVE